MLANAVNLLRVAVGAMIREHMSSTMRENLKSIEQIAKRRMRLFSHWLDCWEEDMQDEEVPQSQIRTSFGLLQLRDLRETLDKLESKLEQFEEHW